MDTLASEMVKQRSEISPHDRVFGHLVRNIIFFFFAWIAANRDVTTV